MYFTAPNGTLESMLDNVLEGLSNQTSTDQTDHKGEIIGGGVGGGGFLVMVIGVVVYLKRKALIVERFVQKINPLLDTIKLFLTKKNRTDSDRLVQTDRQTDRLEQTQTMHYTDGEVGPAPSLSPGPREG